MKTFTKIPRSPNSLLDRTYYKSVFKPFHVLAMTGPDHTMVYVSFTSAKKTSSIHTPTNIAMAVYEQTSNHRQYQHFFPNFPAYMSKKELTPRSKTTSFTMRRVNEMHRLDDQTQTFLSMDKVNTINKLWNKLLCDKLPGGFKAVKMHLPDGLLVISIRIDEIDIITGMPVISHNLTIFSDLHFKLHQNGVDISIKNISDLTTK